MKYKAIIFDIDGTLTLPAHQELSEKVITSILSVHDKIYVSLATGRILDNNMYGARSFIQRLKITGPCILDQGTQIYDPKEDKIIVEIPLDKNSVSPVVDIFRTYKLPLKYFDGKKDTEYNFLNHPPKIVSFFTEDFDRDIIEKLENKLRGVPNISLHKMIGRKMHSASIEVTHISATKQRGIEEIAKKIGIQTHEMIGVGDGYNDFPLLMACGLKIAMGNAVPELKAIADFIAPSVEEDGVATVIEKFIL